MNGIAGSPDITWRRDALVAYIPRKRDESVASPERTLPISHVQTRPF
jgi:hypothetical protein